MVIPDFMQFWLRKRTDFHCNGAARCKRASRRGIHQIRWCARNRSELFLRAFSGTWNGFKQSDGIALIRQ